MNAKPKLKPDELYEGDNGRITCGKLHCAGMTAHFSGRTTAGQRVKKMTAADNAEWVREFGEPMKCETCKQPCLYG
jgi:hypothetical protein